MVGRGGGAKNLVTNARVGTDESVMVLSISAYDLNGELVSQTVPGLGTTSFTNYDDGTYLVRKTIYADESYRVEKYYADGQLAEVGGSAAMPVKYEYGADANGAFTKEIKVVGGATNEWVKTYAHPFGGTKKVVYSASSGAPTHWYTYNNKGQLIEEVDPDGVKTTYGYNALGEQVTRITGDRRTDTVKDYTPDGGKNWERMRTWAWDGGQSNLMSTALRALDGTETRSQTHSGDVTLTHRTVTAYPAATKRVLTQYAPDDSYSVAVYVNGFLVGQGRHESGSGCLATNSFEYDPHGRLIVTTDERNGAETVQQYGEADLLVTNTVSGPGDLSQSSVFEYDSRGQLVTPTLPDEAQVVFTYHTNGLPKKTSGARTYPVEYGYDDQGRKTAMTTWQDAGGAGVDTVWIYDGYRGWLKEKKYDTSVQGPVYDYTEAGRLKTRTWARGIVTTYTTNLLGEVGEIAYGTNMAAVQFGHDYLGRVTSVTNGAMTTSLEYNNAGQLERESHSGGPLDGLSVSNSYDSLLRLQTVGVWRSGTNVVSQSFNYDSGSRLLTVAGNGFYVTNYYYPTSSFLQALAFRVDASTPLTTTRTYDGLDRLTGISSVPSASSAVLFSYGYDQADQRIAVTNADNSRWEHGYDFLGQVTNGVKKWPDNSAVAGQQFAYDFDDIGNRLWTTRDGRQTDYANNDLNQITGRTVPGYVNVLGSATNASKVTVNYQATGRKGDYFYKELAVTNSAGPVWLAVTNLAVLNNGTNADIIATNIGNLYIPPASESLTYDADGNLTSDGRWDNGWDAENRLISQETTESAVAAGIPKEKLDHAYDWRWRRIQKTVSAWNGSSWTNAYQRKFVYEGWNLQAELDGSGNLVHSFVWGNDASGTRQGAGGVGGLFAMIVHQGTNAGVYFYCYDGSHRVAALVDTNGVVVAHYEYGPFLELIRATGPLARENPFLGTSKYYDWETWLYYYGYRYYDPSTGRWLSRDPIEEDAGPHLYGMLSGDPVNTSDLLGLQIICDCPDKYFKKLGFVKDEHYLQNGNTYSAKPNAKFLYWGDVEKEIVWKMLNSTTTFVARDLRVKQLKKHVQARKTIVQNAKAATFSWRAEANKPDVLNYGPGKPIDFKDDQAAFFQSINNQGTQLRCKRATMYVFESGNLLNPTGARPNDLVFIPGDWPYLDNEAQTNDRGDWDLGFEGENLIFVGDGQFYGHPYRVKNEQAFRDYITSWKSKSGKPAIPRWGNHSDEPQAVIKYPGIGLVLPAEQIHKQ